MRIRTGIRTKILIIVGCAFVLFMATLTIVSQVVVLEGFNKLETEYVNINAQRTMSELDSIIGKVASISGDWAPCAYSRAIRTPIPRETGQ